MPNTALDLDSQVYPYDEVKRHLRLQSQRKVFPKEIQPLDMCGVWHTSAQQESRSTWFRLEEYEDVRPNKIDFIVECD